LSLLFIALAFASSALLVRAFIGFSSRKLLDKPGERSSHQRPTPTGGGFPALVAWFFVTLLAAHFGVVPSGPRWLAALLVGTTLACIGLLDDALDLPRSLRYLAQLLVASAALLLLRAATRRFGLPDTLTFVLGVVFVTGLVNAFNFMDGVDALVASSGLLIMGFYAWLAREPLWALVAAAYAGFLLFNRPRARIFMGDAGSTALGGLVGIAFLSSERLELPHLVLLGPLVSDSAYTIVRRLLRRENIFVAHHSHVYQRLLRAGWSHGQLSGTYAALTMLMGLLVAGWGLLGSVLGAATCAAAIVGAESYIARRKVPFTRPAAAKSSA
jgi:Fuc2NAc and GlcNAc transferase